MDNIQVTNLLKFSFLFHNFSDNPFMSCDMDYIWEKYNYLIGFNPTSNSILENTNAINLKKQWVEKWHINSILDKNKDLVLNYLCMVNVNPIIPSIIFELFKKYIGDVNNITKENYKIHPLVETIIEEYKVKLQRELNLEILI